MWTTTKIYFMVYENDPNYDKTFNKKKKDILYLLNKNDRKSKTKPNKKYDIKYDSELRKYY